MTQVSVTEFRNKLAEYLERAEKVEEIVFEGLSLKTLNPWI
jgi:antitoxin (DNA-binding transcriptional repressor) of toxin-antitoxin stability system